MIWFWSSVNAIRAATTSQLTLRGVFSRLRNTTKKEKSHALYKGVNLAWRSATLAF
jgi:hypothetical protein